MIMAALITGTTASPLTQEHNQRIRNHSCLITEPRPARNAATNVTMPADANKQLEKPERRSAKTLQTTAAWADHDLQQTELARSSSDTHHEVEAR